MCSSLCVLMMIDSFSVQNLEKHPQVKLAHINPHGYTRTVPCDSADDGSENETMWFVGLVFDKNEAVVIDLTDAIRNFVNTGRYTILSITAP